MALQTANQFQLTPDLVGAASRGLQLGNQFRQSQQQAANQQLGTQQQAILDDLSSKAAAGDPQALTQLSGIAPDRAQQIQTFQATQQENRFKSVVRGAQEIQNISDPTAKLAFLKQRRAELQGQNIDTSDTDEVIGLFESGDIAGGNALIDQVVQSGVQSGFLKALPTKKAAQDFTLSPGQQRFDAAGRLIAGVDPKVTPSDVKQEVLIPDVLLQGLDPELSEKGAAAFSAAGGGKDGLKAFQEIVDKGTEQQRRLASPAILKANFPQASRAEQAQLQGVMDAAKTTESGLKEAGKVRVEQKRLKKAAVFQDRAVELLTGILGNDELGDVLGSVEGSFDFRLQDSEAELIADIEEAGNILTADNLSLMSGVLSESDIKILKNLAGGGLIRTRTEKRFIKDVTALRDKLASQKVVTIDERDAVQGPAEGATATGPSGEKAVFTNGQWVVQNAG